MRVILWPFFSASARQRLNRFSNARSSIASFFNGWRSTPGTMPATSQLDWLISITAINVASISSGSRHRLRSFTVSVFRFVMTGLHRYCRQCSDGYVPSLPPHSILTAASTLARWRYRSGRRPCVAAEHLSSPRRSSRIPGSRSRSLYRSPGTPIGKSIDYLDFATIKLPAPAYPSSTATPSKSTANVSACSGSTPLKAASSASGRQAHVGAADSKQALP